MFSTTVRFQVDSVNWDALWHYFGDALIPDHWYALGYGLIHQFRWQDYVKQAQRSVLARLPFPPSSFDYFEWLKVAHQAHRTHQKYASLPHHKFDEEINP